MPLNRTEKDPQINIELGVSTTISMLKFVEHDLWTCIPVGVVMRTNPKNKWNLRRQSKNKNKNDDDQD